MAFPPKVWDSVVRRLETELPAHIRDAWLEPLGVETTSAGVRLSCPSPFHLDRVRSRLLPSIERCFEQELGATAEIELCVTGDAPAGPEAPESGSEAARGRIAVARSATKKRAPARARTEGRRTTRGEARVATGAPAPSAQRSQAPAPAAVPAPRSPLSPLSPEKGGAAGAAQRSTPAPVAARATPTGPRQARLPYTFDSFVVGGCNALAREASLMLARRTSAQLSQLFLCSGSGLGKTHLSRAVVGEARSAQERALYTSAEGFTNEFLSSLRNRETSRFKRKFRHECDLLVVEDLHFLEGKASTQLELFHTVQHLLEAGSRVVFTADRSPQQLTGLEPRLQSQLAGSFVAELEPPDAQVRRSILRSKASSGGVRLPDACLDLLVDSVRGSVRDLEGVLIQLVTTASLLKRRIDLELTREALERRGASLGERAARIDVGLVIRVVAAFFKTTPDVLASRTRRRDVLVPRQLAMYLCRRYTEASTAEIGRAFERDHPSVRNAIRKVERAILERAPMRYQVEALSERLEEHARERRTQSP